MVVIMNRLTVNINISNADESFPFYVDVSFIYHRKYLTQRNTTCVLNQLHIYSTDIQCLMCNPFELLYYICAIDSIKYLKLKKMKLNNVRVIRNSNHQPFTTSWTRYQQMHMNIMYYLCESQFDLYVEVTLMKDELQEFYNNIKCQPTIQSVGIL